MTCRIDRLLMQNDDVVLRISGQITGSVPSGIAGDEPLTEMALRIA